MKILAIKPCDTVYFRVQNKASANRKTHEAIITTHWNDLLVRYMSFHDEWDNGKQHLKRLILQCINLPPGTVLNKQ